MGIQGLGSLLWTPLGSRADLTFILALNCFLTLGHFPLSDSCLVFWKQVGEGSSFPPFVHNGPQLDNHDLGSYHTARWNKILIGGSPIFVEKATDD